MLRGVLFSAWVVLAASCGGSEQSGGGGTTSGASHCPATPSGPPSSLNVELCHSLADDQSIDGVNQCSTCCKNGGFSNSGFINAGHCTCGNVPPGDGVTVCASKIATEDECSACCDSGYSGYVFSQGQSCECGDKLDANACACALSDPDPSTSCSRCCLDHGYLAMMYIGIGTPECACSGGG